MNRGPPLVTPEPPIAGSVLRYAYLWSYEDRSGLAHGSKDRPVALVVSKGPDAGRCVVVPITHREPEAPAVGIEIPAAIRTRVGLDDERQWIVLTEINVFRWPGADLGAVPGRDPPTALYGTLPRAFFAVVLAQMKALIRARRVEPVDR